MLRGNRLSPLSVGNRWIYQSVHNRLDLDTVTVFQETVVNGQRVFDGTFSPPLGMLFGSVIARGDSIFSTALGLQFVIPDQLPADMQIASRASCYSEQMTRHIVWSIDPVIVPAGTFFGCFEFTTTLDLNCQGGFDTIIEEVFIKPGVGIVKINQIRSSDCLADCSSRWELLAWSVE